MRRRRERNERVGPQIIRDQPLRSDGVFPTYLDAVKAAGTTDTDKVMDELHKMKISDAFVQNATIRADGLLEHDMYIMEVKKPSESKGEWDYYKLLKTMSGAEAFGKLADSTCPLVKK